MTLWLIVLDSFVRLNYIYTTDLGRKCVVAGSGFWVMGSKAEHFHHPGGAAALVIRDLESRVKGARVTMDQIDQRNQRNQITPVESEGHEHRSVF